MDPQLPATGPTEPGPFLPESVFMNDFLNIIFSLPTVVFTIFVGVIVLYWVFVLLGALDLDLFDLDVDLDADVDLDVDIDVDVDVDMDVDMDLDGGGVGDIGVIAGTLSAIGWTGVPLTITLSVFILLNWTATFLSTYYLRTFFEGAVGTPARLGVLAASLFVCTFLTSLVIRPLRSAIKTAPPRKGALGFLGRSVTITTSEVTARTGRAYFEDEDGTHLDLAVRCDQPNNGLVRGSQALIIGYDEDTHVYHIESMGSMLDPKLSNKDMDVVFDQLAQQEAKQSN